MAQRADVDTLEWYIHGDAGVVDESREPRTLQPRVDGLRRLRDRLGLAHVEKERLEAGAAERRDPIRVHLFADGREHAKALVVQVLDTSRADASRGAGHDDRA